LVGKLYDRRPTLAQFEQPYNPMPTRHLVERERSTRRKGVNVTACSMEGQTMFNAFLKDESGAVTVDWVVLTAAIVGLGIAVLTSVGGGTTTLANKVSSHMGAQNVTTSTFWINSGG